jgi:putative SOS response-associated peptidase YedK
MGWGLVPNWAKDASGAARMINARSETAHTLPAFREAMKLRRCLVPADGFYEWQRRGSAKQPYCFEVDEGELFAFAGLWDGWKDANGNWIKTCSILTTTPNAVASAIHDRMPVILDPDSYDLWLDPGMRDGMVASELLKPCDAERMRSFPVSTRSITSKMTMRSAVNLLNLQVLRIDYSPRGLVVTLRQQPPTCGRMICD